MERSKADSRQLPIAFPDIQPEEDKELRGDGEPTAGENVFLKEVELHAPQIVNILARHVDRGFAEGLVPPTSDEAAPGRASLGGNPSSGNPIDALAGDLARLVVDSIFAPKVSPADGSSAESPQTDQRELGRMEERARQRSVRLNSVERGSSERSQPTITLGPKAKEIAQAFGISEDKLAKAASERLRRKGVLRP